MNTTQVLALLPLFIVLAHSFSWDIVVGREERLEFFYNGKITHTEYNPSYWDIYAVTYDPVHSRVLFVDHVYKRMSISSFDLRTRKVQNLIRRQTSVVSYMNLAYDPVTQLVFWTEDKKIYSLSLKPASSNETVHTNLLVTLEYYCWDIAVDSCGGFIYWIVDDKIERAAFDGSHREVLIDSGAVVVHSLAIDLQTEKMYWTERTSGDLHHIKSADLNGKNRRTVYFIGKEDMTQALTISKDFIYWRSHDQGAILQLPKHQQHGVAPTIYTKSNKNDDWCQITAANYTIEEQTLGNKSCEALKRLILDMKECHASICQNYCFQGNCSVSTEEHPKCSCEAGYSGERCEVNACYMYCLNNGVCSVNEEGKTTCQCTSEYQGERCDVSICKDYCLHGDCSISIEGQRTCSCHHGYYGERCDVSICKDYCFEGNCSVNTEAQPTCRCNAGYSGERCEVNTCHSYCLNNGNCSLNEENQPVCQCTADYVGERCDVATIRTVVCVSADKMTQQMLLDLRSEVKQVKENLQCTLQLYTDKLDENAAKIQICEESMNDNQQNSGS